MTAIDEIKEKIDIVDLVSETVKLRRAGKNYTGFCPFHANTRTPAFVVFPDSGTWRCFGQCAEGGDIFQYVMKKEGCDFSEALKILAGKAGVQLEPLTPQKKEEDDVHERLRGLLEEAVNFFRHHLLQSQGGRAALDLLTRRGLTSETIEAFGLGYAPNSWDAALAYFRERSYTVDEMMRAGLLSQREDGSSVYDRFRNRVMFPIRDMNGKMAGFGARILDPNDNPKFLNSPQTALFDKGHLLFGLDVARKSIRGRDQVVIVEGYLDVIVLHQAGFTNTVSPMGTALTEDQLRLLKRFSRRMVLALDADAAGQKATLRGLEVARQTLDRQDQVAFDARGLLRHEGRLQADLRVTTIPDGMDPDEVVLRDPAEWEKILAAAQPIVVHVMESLAAGRDLDDPKTKGEIATQILPLIEDVPEAVEREAYRQRLARLLRVDERSLMAPRAPGRVVKRPGGRKPGGAGPAGGEGGASTPQKPPTQSATSASREREQHILSLLFRHPEAQYLLDRALLEAGLGRFNEVDFDNAETQMLARLLQESLEQDQVDPMVYVQDQLPEFMTVLFENLTKPYPLGEPTTDRLLEDLFHSLILLRHKRVADALSQLRFMQQDLQQQGELHLDTYTELFMQYTRTLSLLDRALSKPFQSAEKEA